MTDSITIQHMNTIFQAKSPGAMQSHGDLDKRE